MKCAYGCDAKTYVTETRILGNTTYRIHRCSACDKTFPTAETQIDRLPVNVHKLSRGTGAQRAKRKIVVPSTPVNSVFALGELHHEA